VNYTEKGSVTVSFKKNKNRLKILISDTGIGMSSDDKVHIFEKFSRGTRAVNTNPNGSGLGLYIANEIMKAHGSGIKVEKTEINKGTIFSFHLKISDNKKSLAAKDIGVNKAKKKNIKNVKKFVNKKRPNILMIEDEQNLLHMYRKFFKQNNCSFTASTKVETALQKIKQNNFDIVILDIMLKENKGKGKVKLDSEQGWQILEAIKKDKSLKKLPVIVFSNLNSLADEKKAKKLGADNFLFKENTEPRNLMLAINKIIRKKEK
jgi:CheY-like chemotaxis protein